MDGRVSVQIGVDCNEWEEKQEKTEAAERKRKKYSVNRETEHQNIQAAHQYIHALYTDRGWHMHTFYLILYWSRNLPSYSLSTERDFDTLLLPCFIQHKRREKNDIEYVCVCS